MSFHYLEGKPQYKKIHKNCKSAQALLDQANYDLCASTIGDVIDWASQLICKKRGITPVDKDGKPSKRQLDQITAIVEAGIIQANSQMVDDLHYVRKCRNRGTHENDVSVTKGAAEMMMDCMDRFLQLAVSITESGPPAAKPQPKPSAIPAISRPSQPPKPVKPQSSGYTRQQNIAYIESVRVRYLHDEGYSPDQLPSLGDAALDDLRRRIEQRVNKPQAVQPPPNNLRSRVEPQVNKPQAIQPPPNNLRPRFEPQVNKPQAIQPPPAPQKPDQRDWVDLDAAVQSAKRRLEAIKNQAPAPAKLPPVKQQAQVYTREQNLKYLEENPAMLMFGDMNAYDMYRYNDAELNNLRLKIQNASCFCGSGKKFVDCCGNQHLVYQSKL